MTGRKTKNLFVFALILALAAMGRVEAQAVTVVVLTAWNPTLTHSGAAGDDLDPTYQNTMDNYRLTVSGGSYGSSWHVHVAKTISPSDPDYTLQVMRDPAETKIVDGNNWVTVPTGAGAYFFRTNGFKNVSKISLQYRLINVSAGTPNTYTGTKQVTITYTIEPGAGP